MSSLGRLLRFAAPYRRDIVLGSAYSVANKFFDVLPELLIGVAVDVVVNRQTSFVARLGLPDPLHQLIALTVLTALVWIFESLFEYLYALRWRGLAQNIQHSLRQQVYQHLQALPPDYVFKARSGRLLAVLNEDVNQIERFLNTGANDLIQVFVSSILVGAVFFALTADLAVLAFLPIPLILFGTFWFQQRLAPRYAAAREAAASVSNRLNNNLAGMATIQAFTAEDFEARQVAAVSDTYRARNAEAIRFSAAITPVIRMAILAGFIATLFYGGWKTLHGELGVGSYSALVYLTQRLLWPLTRMAEMTDLFQRSMASVDRALDLLAEPLPVRPERVLPGSRQGLSGVERGSALGGETIDELGGEANAALRDKAGGGLRRETIGVLDDERIGSRDETGGGLRDGAANPPYAVRFESVWLAYEGVPALRGVSIDVPAGHTVALVGGTGGGKTSVLKLLMGFAKPDSGCVRIDGIDLATLDPFSVRRLIGYVAQDSFLTDGSVAENIAYGDRVPEPARIESAARAAEVHEFIATLPSGYDSAVGERGTRLSGGQRQRIALARALYRDPRILVLDEATSAVDNETEAAIHHALERVRRGRTTLMVAHRLSTVRHADCIHVLEAGQVVESGTHEQLMAQQGVYARLWQLASL